MRWRDVPPLQHSSPPIDENCEVPPKDPLSEPPTGHYFKVILLTGYYIGAVPFKPHFDKTSRQYLFQQSRQKYFCYTLWTLSIVNRLTTLRRSFTTTYDTPSSVSYFQLVHSVIHLISYAVYFYTLLFSSSFLLSILNATKSSTLLTFNSLRNHTLRIILLSTQLTWLLFTIASPIVGYEILNSCCWSFDNLFRAYVAHGRYSFFVCSSILETTEEATPFSGIDGALCVAQIMITTTHVCLLFFIVCIFGNCALTLWGNAAGFYDSVMATLGPEHLDVERQRRRTLNLVDCYKDLKGVVASVNSTWHLLAFWYIIDLMSWLSTELDSGLRTKDYFVKIHIFYYLVYACGALCFSAEAFRKTEKLKAFLRNLQQEKALVNGDNCGQDVDYVLRCLDSDVEGLGEVGFFKFNYAFIGQMTGLIITFYIISVGEHLNEVENQMPANGCGPCYCT